MPVLFIVVHVFAMFWLVAGILGRDLVYRRAARSTDLTKLRSYVELGGVFERAMVRPATMLVLVTGLVAAWARGWPILGFLQGAETQWVLVSIVIYLTIVPLVAFVFLPRGKRFRAALDEATSQGQVTPRLAAALHDPIVEAARVYELLMIGVLTWLMVARPF